MYIVTTNWSELLPLTEFAYNDVLSATTGVSPFFTNKRYHPNITVHPERDIASFWACNFTVDLDELQNTLKAEISTAQQCYQKSADIKNERSRLNIFLFSSLIFILFSIYFIFFSELGLGLEWQDHTVTQQVTSDDTVTSHMIHGRM